MHIVSLSFDDGFRQSVGRVAELYEKHGCRACFNVIATGHLGTFVAPDSSQAGIPKGDFQLWNDLRRRGHEIMPHGYRHARKPDLPLAEAQRLIRGCLAVFTAELEGFQTADAVFNFPYNKSTPALEAWLPTVVRAFRTAGGGINPLPRPGLVKLTTTGWGPGNCEHHLDAEIDALLRRPSGWLIYNTHGLDAEGWGPIGAEYLDRLLDRLLSIPTVRILPTAQALRLAGKGTDARRNQDLL